ncbi:MAG: S-layer homology domain-containing protein [Sedimentibacter sp.]
MKKVLSLVLVIAMVLSSMSFAFASTPTDIADSDYKKAIETLVALGIIDGYDDGTYRPEKTITRAELAKILVTALGYGDLVDGAASEFPDTANHWAKGYVAIAAGTGLVLGYPDGTFRPENVVSYDEALTMLVRSLGYTDAVLKGTWPTNYKVKAIDLDLNDDVEMKASGADRGGVAQIFYNALQAKMVEIDEDGLAVPVTPEKLFIDNVASLEKYYYVGTDRFDEDDNDYAGNLVDLTPYVYQYLDVYTNGDDEVVYVKSVKSETLTGTVNKVDEAAGTIEVKDANGDKYTIKTAAADITVYYNGEQTTIADGQFNEKLYRGNDVDTNYDALEAKITVISGDSLDTIKAGNSEEIKSNDTASHFIVERATKAILVDNDYVAGKAKISGEDGTISLPVDDGEVDLEKITVIGAADSLEDIVEGDVVVSYESADGTPVKLVVVRDTIEGVVTKTASSATTVYVDGKEYSLSRINGSVRYGTRPAVDDEGIFYLDNAGKIFAVDTDGAALTDYAIVLNKAGGTYTDRLNGSVKDYPQLELLTFEGEKVVYDVLAELDLSEGVSEDKLDDYATYSDDAVTNDTDHALVTVDTTNKELDLAYTFTTNELVKYSVNEDGFIDEIQLMDVTGATIDLDDIDDIAAEDAIVFNTVDEEVTTVDFLKDNQPHTVLYKDGEIVVIVTANVEAADDDIYGVIASTAKVKNAAGDIVTEVTALVDGAEVVYLAENDNAYTVSTDSAVKFNFGTDDELDSAVELSQGAGANQVLQVVSNATVTNVTSSYIELSSTELRFASDVAVYIYDISADEITVGDVSDLNEGSYQTVVYNTSKTTGIANIIVQVQP